MSHILKLYEDRLANPDEWTADIRYHFTYLRNLACHVNHITEFGTRSGNSTLALLTGLESSLLNNLGPTFHSYDVDWHKSQIEAIEKAAAQDGIEYTFHKAPAQSCVQEKTELLFIDSWHAYEQVVMELETTKFMPNLKHIVFHDTELFGWFAQRQGNRPGSGILPAILEFMESTDWKIIYYTRECNGLLHIRLED